MKKKISIIGGGPSALLLAAFLDNKKFNVSIYEQNNTLGRKFLLAGKGGFNLTHSEPIAQFVERYTPVDFLKTPLFNFNNKDLRDWLRGIGISTFVGSSKRVYPTKEIRPTDLLTAIAKVLDEKSVTVCANYKWTGWINNNVLVFNNKLEVESDYVVFALGGGSWKSTGSDGEWLSIFKAKGIEVLPFQASNCNYTVNWPPEFIQKFEGYPLKNISITCSDKVQKGEVVITNTGIEGNAIYALSPHIRSALNEKGKASIYIDLKPGVSKENILNKIAKEGAKNTTEILRKALKISAVQLALLKTFVTKEDYIQTKTLVQYLKSLPIEIVGAGDLDEAISTVGGVNLSAVNENFEIKQINNHFCIGEMLDWDAPTGGYLLQASFSMGVYLARYLNKEG